MRPIDADKLKKDVKSECNPYGKPTIGFDDGKKVLKLIDAAPTIEAEPVKRCKVREQCTDIVCENCGKEYSAELPFMARSGKESGYDWFKRCPSCGAYWEWEE